MLFTLCTVYFFLVLITIGTGFMYMHIVNNNSSYKVGQACSLTTFESTSFGGLQTRLTNIYTG